MRKKLTWLHVSDIHFCPKTEWRDSTSRVALLDYLQNIFSSDESLRPDLIFCTGDIAYGELSQDVTLSMQYEQAKEFFNKLLLVCGVNNKPLPTERLFIVPGNHDVNRYKINTDTQDTLNGWAENPEKHVSKINQRFQDCSIEFIENIKRLDEYVNFVKEYLPHQHDDSGRVHYTNISEINGLKVGIAGFNSAWTCSGSKDDRKIWLAGLWQFNSANEKLRGADIKIGLIHHPTDWFNSAERKLVSQRAVSDFDFFLHGHNHNAWVTPIQSHIIIAAGAVTANTSDEFGINIVSLDFDESKGIAHLHSKKLESSGWTLAPIDTFANNGEWLFQLPESLRSKFCSQVLDVEKSDEVSHQEKSDNKKFVNRFFERRLNEALKSFSSQPKVWIEPKLYTKSEIAIDAKSEHEINLKDFIDNPKSTIIKAPPQYGLTCLAHFLIKEAWGNESSALWLYLDSKDLKPHNSSIKQAITEELSNYEGVENDIKCVILDSWSTLEKDSHKLLNKLCEHFKDIPIICMHQVDSDLFGQIGDEKYARELETLYLWALRKEVIRQIVNDYNEEKQIGDEDEVTTRLASDLEVLNLHRTPLNCLTLLKVFEIDFDESPINRSEILQRVLFLLFNADDIPTYKSKPDLKDCEYVLGYFCELLIKSEIYTFTREYFLTEILKCCREGLLDLDVHVVFEVLNNNNILIKRGDTFNFKFAYWFYYFAARRMYHDEDFANFMLEGKRYVQYPELIEFYTGIDRKREDALKVLLKDMQECNLSVKERCGLPSDMNPYKFAKWESSNETIEQMHAEITNGVLDSNLPAEIKDQYSDRDYDPAKPYKQDIKSVLFEYSFINMMQTMRAGARALRNSDYASPAIKRAMLGEILHCWEISSRVIFIILPLLAKEGHAIYDETRFVLSSDFGDTPEERFFNLLMAIPSIIVNWSKDDLFSKKMGPLLIDQLHNKEIDELSKHELILVLIKQRPRDWSKQIQDYITICGKNSFYLMDIYRHLRIQYRYGYAIPSTLKDIEYLIKMTLTKHITGNKNPGKVTIRKTFNKNKFKNDIIPKREV
ncbi:Calcineurin-like phosphoesterase [Nitrosomonas sp. Nm51]|uniref:metallophosphoesterase family protein n=1 Tax=Nitrosomonas sp. Nm51 TaxID=133720 RepID=UPI0008C7671E|nr:metallophosphoesterase [Nitrosomonas sp. Nm51]SER76252.1 Calcineurin-like phosphoesterase [Nitrosomonas sp. Nm51]